MKYLGLKRVLFDTVAVIETSFTIGYWNRASIAAAINNRIAHPLSIPVALYDAARELDDPDAEEVTWYKESAAE